MLPHLGKVQFVTGIGMQRGCHGSTKNGIPMLAELLEIAEIPCPSTVYGLSNRVSESWRQVIFGPAQTLGAGKALVRPSVESFNQLIHFIGIECSFGIDKVLVYVFVAVSDFLQHYAVLPR